MKRTTILDGLGRITTSGRVIPQIDGLRFVAIAAVVLYHAAGYVEAKLPVAWSPPLTESWLHAVARHGHYGVQLFFAISGFILALPFAKHHLRAAKAPALGGYFLRRLTRLEPPYVLTLLLLFALRVSTGRAAGWAEAPHLLASLAYQHNLVYGMASTVNSVAWSLEIEIQFYVLAPLLAYVFAVRPKVGRRVLMAVIWGLAIAARQAIPKDSLLAFTLPNYLEFFWAGFILAELYVSEWADTPSARAWDLVSLAGWPALLVVWSTPRLAFAIPLLTLALYAAALRGPWSARAFSNRWIVVIGGMCYSIYLLHYPVISAVGSISRSLVATSSFDVNLLIQLCVLAPAILLVSAAFFAAVERPCMRPDWPRSLRAGMVDLASRMWGVRTPDL